MFTIRRHCVKMKNMKRGFVFLRAAVGVFASAVTVQAAVDAAGAADGDRMTLVERGHRSAYVVVIPASPSPCLRHAAEELTNYVAKLTDVELPIAEGVAGAGTRSIRIRSKGAVGNADAFRFRTEGHDFVIEGESDRAALFGVYDFLENQCGCEWLSASCEIVPARVRIEVPATFALERSPRFVNRECAWTEVRENPDFAAKLKLDGFCLSSIYTDRQGGKPPDFDRILCSCHSLQWVVPAKKYFKDHPDWFAEVKGVRQGEGPVQLCLSNPELLRYVTAYVKKRIRENYPKVKCYGISQNDAMGYCTCPQCKAIDDREGSPSGSVVEFVNKVAAEVEKEWPDVIIQTLAYMYSRPAPKTLKCRDNVMITLCTDSCDLSHPMVGNRFRARNWPPFSEDLARWQKIAKRIYIWDYALNFCWLWHALPSLAAMKPNYGYFADCGVTHVYLEGGHHGRHSESSEIKLWLAAHLLWDPYQPVEPLMDRFLTGYFGAGAPFARRYYDEMATLVKDEAKTPQLMWGTLDSPALTDEFFEHAAGYWREAMAAVKGDRPREINVGWAMNATDYTRIMRAKPEQNVRAPRFREFREAAKRIQRDVDNEKWPEVRIYGQDLSVDRSSKERIRRLATMDVEKVAAMQAKGGCEERHPIIADKLTLACKERVVRVKPEHKPFAGPATVVVRTERSPKGGRAVLRLKECGPDAKPVAYDASWAGGFAFFDVDLDPKRTYELVSLEFLLPDVKSLRVITVEKIDCVSYTARMAMFTK